MEVFAKIEDNSDKLQDDEKIVIYDMSGKDIYLDKIVRPIIRELRNFVFVYDCSSSESYERAKKFHELVLKEKSGGKFTGTLVGNKNDFAKSEVSKEDAEAFARKNNLNVVRTSVKEHAKVASVFRAFLESK